MIRPKLTKPEADQIILSSGLHIPELIKVLAIRGYYLNTMGTAGENDRGIYDDAFFLFGPGYFGAFNANTDPSKHKPGIAKLCLGLHYFKKGNHGISRPGGGYPAFRPATPDEGLPVTRDGQTGVSRGIAINIHQGGEVYTNSAGCQTVYPLEWLEFQKTAYTMMSNENQKTLPYLLCEKHADGTFSFQQ